MGFRIFCGNIPYSSPPEDLEAFFGKFGKLANVNMREGFAFIDFENEDEGRTAVAECHNQEFQGRRLQVEVARGRGEARNRDNEDPNAPPGATRHLYVARIPETVTEEELQTFFQAHGNVLNVKMLPQKGDFRSAFVDFEQVDNAIAAFRSTELLHGAALRLDFNNRGQGPVGPRTGPRDGPRGGYGRGPPMERGYAPADRERSYYDDRGGYDRGYSRGGSSGYGRYDYDSRGGYDRGDYDRGGHDRGYDRGYDRGGAYRGGYDRGGDSYDRGGDRGMYDRYSYEQRGGYDRNGGSSYDMAPSRDYDRAGAGYDYQAPRRETSGGGGGGGNGYAGSDRDPAYDDRRSVQPPSSSYDRAPAPSYGGAGERRPSSGFDDRGQAPAYGGGGGGGGGAPPVDYGGSERRRDTFDRYERSGYAAPPEPYSGQGGGYGGAGGVPPPPSADYDPPPRSYDREREARPEDPAGRSRSPPRSDRPAPSGGYGGTGYGDEYAGGGGGGQRFDEYGRR
mmetsp:Transcript_15926/g.42879  ORF Transcript_15926/g.42879 Transcript_15926/m.42879 type:complete len:507 (+) Transcript_15926:113-1633(+)